MIAVKLDRTRWQLEIGELHRRGRPPLPHGWVLLGADSSIASMGFDQATVLLHRHYEVIILSLAHLG